MTLVSDTGPLIALVKIAHLSLLPQLGFDAVYIPTAVQERSGRRAQTASGGSRPERRSGASRNPQGHITPPSTNVVSEARKTRRADQGVRAFFARAAEEQTPLYLSVVTIGELRRGVELIRHRGDELQAQRLERWLEGSPHGVRGLYPRFRRGDGPGVGSTACASPPECTG